MRTHPSASDSHTSPFFSDAAQKMNRPGMASGVAFDALTRSAPPPSAGRVITASSVLATVFRQSVPRLFMCEADAMRLAALTATAYMPSDAKA